MEEKKERIIMMMMMIIIITTEKWKTSPSQDSVCFTLSWCYSLESISKVRKDNKEKYAAYH